jgi:glycosyltransferase involved in cell wall biosynthesis
VVADQLDEYVAALDPRTYLAIIVGKKGLANQRQFIQDHFSKDQFIVFMDDDIRAIKRKHENRLVPVTDIGDFFTLAFNTMIREEANIWGVVAAANPLFMKGNVTTDLKYIIGALYGIRNTKDPALTLEHGDNQEDKERTILYWKRDGKVVRMNSYTIQTAYYAKGGMDSPTRKEETKTFTDLLVSKYPQYVRQVYKVKTEIYDLRFRKNR